MKYTLASPRNVSLRTLLSFTSGFGSDEEGSDNVTKSCMDNPLYLGGTILGSCSVFRGLLA